MRNVFVGYRVSNPNSIQYLVGYHIMSQAGATYRRSLLPRVTLHYQVEHSLGKRSAAEF